MPYLSSTARAALLALGLGACASTPQAAPVPPVMQPPVQQPTPPPAAAPAPPSVLQPPESAVRSADRVQLTGTELGTMWTFENPPLEYWAKQYNFRPTPDWLERIRLASVRFGTFCSASFVSPSGLVATNHHCARECVEAQSTQGTDYVEAGFYAPTRREERLCPGLFLDQLLEIRDVTARVQAAVAQGTPQGQIAATQAAEREKIENECSAASQRVCQVVSLYHGGQFQLYTYRRFAPVKLVFAPELAAGFFGGDPDNFTYPRYTLDVSFVRAYDADSVTPARTPQYLRWRAEGANEGELIFVTGNPGTTNRMATVTQLMYERRYRHPFLIGYLESQRAALLEAAKAGPEAEQSARQDLFEIENSLKAFRGQYAGLQDTLLLARKIRWEREFQQRVNADAALRAQFGDVWSRIAAIQEEKLRTSPRVNFSNTDFFASPQLQLAGSLVQYVRQTSLPEAERREQFRGQKLAELEARLRGNVELNPEMGARMMQQRLDLLRQFLPTDDPVLAQALQTGETPEAAGRRIVSRSRIGEGAYRQALMTGGTATLDTVSDPLIALARTMESTARALAPTWQQILASEQVEQQRLARALFAVYGTKLPPDATFTLRITDGEVRRYPYNGTIAPPFTTLYGLYARAAEFGNKDPFTLPAAFAARRGAVDMATPYNFVATTDITGGNSGSPMIDREARIVGLAFDNNIEGLPNQFLFTTEAARTVGVHSAGITEALRNVYRAPALLSELLGQTER
jgi:hypothetical protein